MFVYIIFLLFLNFTSSFHVNCKDCIFYDPVKIKINNIEIIRGKCLKSGRLNIYKETTVKNATFEYADICRRKNGLCGPEGLYFIDKNIIHIGKM